LTRVPSAAGEIALRVGYQTAMTRLRDWARTLKRDVIAVWIAARDPRVPRSVKLLALAVAAYALSPIDLVPDFIPVLGYLDDLIIVPLGILLVVKLIPPPLMAEFRAQAARRASAPSAGSLPGSLSRSGLPLSRWSHGGSGRDLPWQSRFGEAAPSSPVTRLQILG
jgi:uncharacterized membrane protein YkvA (DUF1232 family)